MTKLSAAMLSVVLLSMPRGLAAQTPYGSGNVRTTIVGTSNIHDWELVSQKGSCTVSLQLAGDGTLAGVGQVQFDMAVNSLKSEHGSQMDNNAYKAMDEPNHPRIRFTGASATVRPAAGGSYALTVNGRLSISSVTRDVMLTAVARMHPDRSATIEGAYPLVTTDYNVKPISIMLGAIKTSANVTIRYAMTVRPQLPASGE